MKKNGIHDEEAGKRGKTFRFGSKLFQINLLSLLLTLMVTGVFFISYEMREETENLKNRLIASANLTEAMIKSSLIFDDKVQAESLLSSYKNIEQTESVFVFDSNKKLFACYKQRGSLEQCLARPGKPGITTNNGKISLVKPIKVNGETIGWVVVTKGTESLWKRLYFINGLAVASLVLALVFSLPLVRRAQQFLLTPLEDLTRTIKKVSLNKDYSVRLSPKGESEIRILIEGFNQLMDQIEENENKLLNQQSNLEKEVLDRTESLKRLNKDLISRSQEAMAANEAKTTFLADMSHELRTPLNSIMGFAQLLESDPALKPDQKEDVKHILVSSKHLLRLISEILDMAKLEAGKIEILQDRFVIRDLVLETIISLRTLLAEKKLDFYFEVDDTVPEVFLGDADKIRQIISNLMVNAIRYTDSGVVTLLVSYNSDHIEIIVKDTGQGIHPKDQARIFDAFVRVGGDLLPGVGLGLSIARKLVAMMGGEIRLEESELGKGSHFLVRLPLMVPYVL